MTIPVSEIQKLDPSADLYFIVLDCTPLGGSTYYLFPGVNGLGASVVWQGVTYTPLPLEMEGFEWSTKGTLPRPKLRVASLDGLVGGLVHSLQDLVGAKVVLKRTYAKYLDAVNFPGGVNASADPTAGYLDEPWIIERKTLETSDVIEFELCTPMDAQNAMIPGRRVTANVCDLNNASICSYSVSGLCAVGLPGGVQAKTLAACKAHSAAVLAVGVSDPAYGFFKDGLPFGAFPGTARIR